MNTTASAQGNAAALLNVIASSPPSECPFERVLTEEMELLHFINNEDVMEHAEEMEEALASIERATARLAQLGQRHRSRVALNASIRRNRERIPELETLILAEIDEAQNEYRMLSLALCEGREQYVEARVRVGNAPISTGNQRRLSRTGRDNSRPNLTRSDMHTILEYERYHDSYKLLEAGFAYVTPREQFENILRIIGREILIEVVTLGLAKYVRVVRAGLTALDRAAAAIAGNVSRAIVSRYQRLSPQTRERLGNLYNRREPDRRIEHPDDGDTVTGTGTRRTTTGCRTGGAVLC